MTETCPAQVDLDALAPVARALLDRARGDAARVLETAEADCRQAVAAARQDADRLLGQAHEQGAADAAMLAETAAARARRADRARVLQAQRDCYDTLRAAAREAVGDLLSSADRRVQLTDLLRDELGPDATVRVEPEGGLVAEAPDGRRLDASVAALTDRALSGLDLEGLWAEE